MPQYDDAATPIPHTTTCRHCGQPTSPTLSGAGVPDFPPAFCRFEPTGEWTYCATLEVGVRKFRYAADLND